MRNMEEWFRLFQELKLQHEQILFTKKWMTHLLEAAELEEEDLIDTTITEEQLHALNEDPYTAVDALDIEYTDIDEFKCFKLWVDKVLYTYFVSPYIVLKLDNDNIADD